MASLATSDMKLALLGLANAGKTSCLKALRREFDAITSLKPTYGIERNAMEFLGKDLLVWDFGGQVTYRNKYLKEPEKHFSDIAYLYFIVDVQDEDAINPSITYFQEIFKHAAAFSPNAKYILLFHKSDPDYDLEKQESIKHEFLHEVEPLLAERNIPAYIYQTSIYKPLSIITAFSQPLLGNEELGVSIAKTLEQFSKENEISYAILFTKNFYEIGHFKDEALAPEEMDEMLMKYLGALDVELEKFEQSGTPFQDHLILSSTFELQFGRTLMPFYLNIAIKESLDRQAILNKLDKLAENFEKIFENVDLGYLLEKSKD